MNQTPIPRYLSKPAALFLAFALAFALFWPAPFAIISPGPVTNLLGKNIKISGVSEVETSGKLYSLSVYVNNPESRPPGFLLLAGWISGKSVVLPQEIVYEEGITTKAADRIADREMKSSEIKAAIAAANFLKKFNPNQPLNWKPSDIDFAMRNIGGPSAGLAFTLALISRIASPELISGRKIAVTGTINESGRVGGVGGIDQKLISAKSSGVTIVVLPQANCGEITVNTSGLRILAVRNLSEAVHGLSGPDYGKSLGCKA